METAVDFSFNTFIYTKYNYINTRLFFFRMAEVEEPPNACSADSENIKTKCSSGKKNFKDLKDLIQTYNDILYSTLLLLNKDMLFACGWKIKRKHGKLLKNF